MTTCCRSPGGSSFVATTDAFHVPLARKAVAAGKHVFVEKPLGVSVEESEDLRAQLAGTDLILQVGTNRRFDPALAHARQFIQDELGDVMSLRAWYYDSVHRYTMTDNLQPVPVTSADSKKPDQNPKAEKRRYFMLTHGSHLVDTARFLAGPLVKVQARLVEKFGAYCWFVAVEFENRALGHLDLTIPVRGDFEEGFRVNGEFGSVNGRLHLPWFHKAGDVECFSVKDDLYRRPLGQDAYTYKLQLENFADAILYGSPMQGATINDGVAAMRALVAISRSVISGDWVALADVTGGV
ncbi:MAG: Gfo/Idh/MocA family oxidoreductase [Caldilineaceae bacterium]